MVYIIIALIAAVLTGVLTLFDNSLLGELYDVVFRCDQYLTTVTGVEFFSVLLPISSSIGMSLIILKFLKKAFDIYGLWTDGDPDADPLLLLTNFIKAVAAALIFQWVYDIFIDV